MSLLAIGLRSDSMNLSDAYAAIGSPTSACGSPTSTAGTPFGKCNVRRQLSPQENGAMCDAVVLCNKLPDACDEGEDVDEVSRGWLRLRRSSRSLEHRPQFEAKFPSCKWTAEDAPPTFKELQSLEKFHTFVLETGRPLDDVYERLCAKMGGVTLFGLRNGFGFLCGAEVAKTVAGSAGFQWPAEVEDAETLFSALCALFRVKRSIPKQKFTQLKHWIYLENTLNDFMARNQNGEGTTSQVSGGRLKSILSTIASRRVNSETVLETIHCVEMLLELEPKASMNQLLIGDSDALGSLSDMVLRQGLRCFENSSVLRLWSLCQKVSRLSISLGCPRPELKAILQTPLSPAPAVKVASPEALMGSARSRTSTNGSARGACPKSERKGRPNSATKKSAESPTMQRSESAPMIGSRIHLSASPNGYSDPLLPQLPKSPASASLGLSPKTPLEKSNAISAISPGRPSSASRKTGSSPNVLLPPLQKSKSASVLIASPKPALEKASAFSSSNGNSPLPPLHKAVSVPTLLIPSSEEKPAEAPALGKIVKRKLLQRSKTATLPEPAAGLSSPGSIGSAKGKTAMPMVRRASIDGQVTDTDHSRRASINGELSDASKGFTDIEWEVNSCALLWSALPPQSITYAMGIAVHSVKRNSLLTKLLRAAWTLLDGGLAVECTMGPVGTMRLRMQMDMLVDHFSQCTDFSRLFTEEDQIQFLNKTRLTLIRLRNMCQSDPRFARVVALYGVAFIAESMCTWFQQYPGAEAMTIAARELAQSLCPYSASLFQKRCEDPFQFLLG